MSNGKRAVTLAIIKQADENMDNMKKALHEITEHFASIYPDIEFNISRDHIVIYFLKLKLNLITRRENCDSVRS